MKRQLYTIFISIIILCLSGCSYSNTNVKVKEKEVVDYNSLVTNTLDNYIEGVNFARENKKELISSILDGNSNNALFIGFVDSLSINKDDFESYKILEDSYFTSYGASAVREIIILNSGNNRMIINCVWGKDCIISLDVKVVGI